MKGKGACGLDINTTSRTRQTFDRQFSSPFFFVVLVFDCLHGGLDRWETVLEARKSTWMASQVGVYVENFVNPHRDVYSGGKRSIFDFLVLKSIGK